MAKTENSSNTDHKTDIIRALIGVMRETSPALAAIMAKYLLPVDSERSQKNQAKFQIETFAELLELWIAGISPDLLIQVLAYYLGILEHHLTEKGTDDFLVFDADGNVPLHEELTHYNQIASDLANGAITLEEALSKALQQVVTPELQDLETDLAELFLQLSGNLSLKKRIGMLMVDARHLFRLRKKFGMWLPDLRHLFRLDRGNGEMSLRDALGDPNTFIMMSNLRQIAHAREDILELNQKTNGRLQQIADYTLEMLVARYTGGNELLANVHAPVESAIKTGEKTVLIGFTYGQSLLAWASADPEFLAAIENQQPEIISVMHGAARLIREMNDASPTALTVWGEDKESALNQLYKLRQKVGPTLRPKEFFIELKKRAETDPTLQRYVDCYARQVVDAEQGEYNMGLFAATDTADQNTWDSFIPNMDFLATDYAETRERVWGQMKTIDQRAADFIGKMIGYHRGLYSFAKGDFDDPRDIEELTMECAKEWRSDFSQSKSEQLKVFKQMLDALQLKGDKKTKNDIKKEALLSGLLLILEGKQ